MDAASSGPLSIRDYATKIPDDQAIWHYRQFAEFVAILQNRALWFSRLDTLRDPFEGVSGRQSRFHQKADEHTRKGSVSCWTVDDEESELMWFAYALGNGVAIRSTKGRLKASFRPPAVGTIVIGVVEYGIDWSEGMQHFMEIPDGYAFQKRRPFKWERELRALLSYEYEYSGGEVIDPTYAGKSVPVDPTTLIAELWVAPYAPNWFRETVETELKRYGYDGIPVKTR